jgi:hypothetical protein
MANMANEERIIQAMTNGATQYIEAWQQNIGGGDLLVMRLCSLLGNEIAVAEVLRLITTTCPHCWNTDTTDEQCYCTRDD